MSKPYGYIFDKQGNLKEISAPFTVKEKLIRTPTRAGGSIGEYVNVHTPVKKQAKIKTGKLHASVGYPNFGK